MAVEFEVPISKPGVAAMEAAPHERPDTREKFGEHKRFREVVIGSRIETFDFLLDKTAGSEHQHRSLDTPLPQFAADFYASHPGQPNIQKYRVIRDVRVQLKCFLSRLGHIHRIGVLAQSPRNEARYFTLVFDQ